MSVKMTRAVICLTTVANAKQARKIASHLVTHRLAACVNVVSGVRSFYRWKGRFCADRELLLVMKTTAAKAKALGRELKRLHPYELPEFVVLTVTGGSRSYLKWLASGVR